MKLLIFLIGILICSFVASCVWHPFTKKGVGNTESSFDTLLSQLHGDEFNSLIYDKNLIEKINYVIDMTEKAKSYCSLQVFKNFEKPELEQFDFVQTKHRLDFVMPDRFHVSQAMWDDERNEYVYDEWISIGDDAFLNAGLWSRRDPQEYYDFNNSLLVKNWIDCLRNDTADKYNLYDIRGKKYLLIIYKIPNKSKIGRGFIEICESLINHDCFMGIWIDFDELLVAKGVFAFKGKTRDGENVQVETHHLFASYNENIKVNPPPWINLEPNDKGELIIVNTEVPIMRFHK